MKRLVSSELDTWLDDPDRRALIVRGARQVGKTWLVHDLAHRHKLEIVEVNFERSPEQKAVFEGASPKQILAELGLAANRDLHPSRCLLFLDEIQEAPSVLAQLRWFTEDLPELAVVAAGSLLEFALAENKFSMPVGRVTYRYVEPMTFNEYLEAHACTLLLDKLRTWSPGEKLSATSHAMASEWYERYAMVGGMPAVVRSDVQHGDPKRCRRIQIDLMATYRDDFAKYVGRMDPSILNNVLLSVATQLGSKFVYSRAAGSISYPHIKQSVELLAKARLITIARHSVAGKTPVAGAIKERNLKTIFLDIGLAHAVLRSPAGQVFPNSRDLEPSIRGKIAEQLAGQQLRVLTPGSGDEAMLHYWQREGGRPGEIDYLVEINQRIIPIEIKAGASGSMKSLHQYMYDKNLEHAVRVDTNPPSVLDVDLKTTQGDAVQYRLLSIPGYLLWRLEDLC